MCRDTSYVLSSKARVREATTHVARTLAEGGGGEHTRASAESRHHDSIAHLCAMFPGLEVEVLVAVLEACGGGLSQAVEQLAGIEDTGVCFPC